MGKDQKAMENNWEFGFLYFNLKDKKMLVPKRYSAMGATVNFAHPLAIAFFILFLIIALLPLFVR
jgi:uncharacterized membrane protein